MSEGEAVDGGEEGEEGFGLGQQPSESELVRVIGAGVANDRGPLGRIRRGLEEDSWEGEDDGDGELQRIGGLKVRPWKEGRRASENWCLGRESKLGIQCLFVNL